MSGSSPPFLATSLPLHYTTPKPFRCPGSSSAIGGDPSQSRFVGLAKQHEATLLCLAREASALGSFASLRAECRRRRVDDGAFEWSVRVVKDKRRGRSWGSARVCDGTVGLR